MFGQAFNCCRFTAYKTHKKRMNIMAKNEPTKSKAELYRDERKARIAKAAKQNSKKSAAGGSSSKIITAAVAAVVVIAIVAGIIFTGAGFTILSATRLIPVATIGETKVTPGQFSYYYTRAYNAVAEQASTNGFDTSKAPDEQYKKNDDGTETLWSEIIADNALSVAQQTIAYYNEAVAAGITLSEDQEEELKTTINEYKTQAQSAGVSFNAFLKLQYGPGFNEKEFTEQLRKEIITQNFGDDKIDEITKSISDEEIEKEYKANQKMYDYTDVRFYTISIKKLSKNEGETDDAFKARQAEETKKATEAANAILEKVTDENSFIEAVKAHNKTEADQTRKIIAASYESLNSAVSKDGAEWAFDAARKAGDKTVITGESAAYIIYCIKPEYTENSVSVRHCLVSFDAKDEKNVTDDEKRAAHKKASDLLAGLGENFTEKDFAAMATANTVDEGSASTGGLYENIRISNSFVEPFETWSFDPARKAGDTGIIETEYGYHIMYFVSDNTDDPDWKNAILVTKGNEKLSEFYDATFAEDGPNKIVKKDKMLDITVKEYCDNIRKMLSRSAMYGY